MKGLLMKDWALMKQRGKILLFLVAWGFLMTFIMDSSSFVVGWIVLIAVITSVSTISYDEYDNCLPFLMSLPVTRRGYAAEKYLFSLLCGAVFWVAGVLIVLLGGLLNGKGVSLSEELPGMVLLFGLTLFVLAVTIPPQLKWGAEKGRIVLIILFAVIGGGAFLLSRFGARLSGLAAKLEALPMWGAVLGALGLGVLLTAVSALISVRIMEKKEF